MVVSSLLSAARFSLGVLALCLLVSAALVYGAGSVRRVLTVPRLIIAGVIGFYFFVVFPTQRNPDLARAVERAVAYSGDAHIAEWVTDQDMSWLNVFAYSTGYFSTALDKLNYFVAATDVFEWNLLGGYNMPQFAPGVWHQARLNIADIMGREGWSLNPWSTGIRDLGIDFGMGLILVVAVLGFISQLVYDKAMASRSYVGLIAATYVSVSCLDLRVHQPVPDPNRHRRAVGNGSVRPRPLGADILAKNPARSAEITGSAQAPSGRRSVNCAAGPDLR